MAHSFIARIVRGTDKDTMGIVIPPEIVEALGKGMRPPVTITIGGYVYRSTVARMGGDFLVGIAKEHRSPAGITDQTEIDVAIALDDKPRVVPVPQELAKALQAAGVRQAFDALSPTRRKEAVRQVESAKATATRERRIAKIIAELTE